MASDPGLSRSTIIIIAVCASVGGLVFIYIVFRLVRAIQRSLNNDSAPLPPIQPLAHHREHQLATLDNRATWYSNQQLTPNSHFAAHSSKTSLLASGGASPNLDSSPNHTFLLSPISPDTAATSSTLTLPNPSFHDFTPSPSSSDSFLPQHTPPRRSHTTSTTDSNARLVRPRPLSTSSLSSSRHAVRGVPHAPRSQVQVILPHLLGPALYPHNKQSAHRDSDRMSVADKWVPVGRDSAPSTPSPTRTSRRFSSGSSLFPSPHHPPHHPPASSAPPTPPLPHLAYPGVPALDLERPKRPSIPAPNNRSTLSSDPSPELRK